MTWEIALGIFTLVSAFAAVTNVTARVNRSLVSLEAAVHQLRAFMERQESRNDLFSARIEDLDIRISRLEE